MMVSMTVVIIHGCMKMTDDVIYPLSGQISQFILTITAFHLTHATDEIGALIDIRIAGTLGLYHLQLIMVIVILIMWATVDSQDSQQQDIDVVPDLVPAGIILGIVKGVGILPGHPGPSVEPLASRG